MYAVASLIIPLVSSIINKKLSKSVWIPLYLGLHLTLLIFPAYFVISLWIPPASASIVSCEMVRMCMKIHSYFREKLMNAQPNEWATYIPSNLKE